MQRFTQLFRELDESNRTSDKVAALRSYFEEAPAEDAVWALWFLTGKKMPALVRSKALRTFAADLSGFPEWLISECYERVGDAAETVALLLPETGLGTKRSLHELVQSHLLALRDWDDAFKLQLLREIWSEMDRTQCLVFNKLITGGFRVGASRTLVIRGLSEAAGIDRQVMTHRLMGKWEPSPSFYRSLFDASEAASDPSIPYPFFLASPLEGSAEDLGPRADWAAEWKWDGIRAQLIQRGGRVFIWSRGDELVTESYPEIAQTAARLPSGTVLDGEILCWEAGRPMGFNALQTRISRKKLTEPILARYPVVFLAYDCLEADGEDLRELPGSERRRMLIERLAPLPGNGAIRLSAEIDAESWSELAALWEESRERGVEGFILKRKSAPYRVGRVKGDWWKWKVDPFTADLVMVYAQAGHGRRASLFTDYTFAARDGDKLLPVAKAYSGLSDAEIREVDRWVKRHTLARRGPVRTVPPELVFEVAFEGIRESTRHKSGLALRFPRIQRWRKDKSPADIDSLDNLRALLRD